MYPDAQNVSRLQAFKASTCLFQFEMQMDGTKISQNTLNIFYNSSESCWQKFPYKCTRKDQAIFQFLMTVLNLF